MNVVKNDMLMNIEVSAALIASIVAFGILVIMPILLPFIVLAGLGALGLFNKVRHLR